MKKSKLHKPKNMQERYNKAKVAHQIGLGYVQAAQALIKTNPEDPNIRELVEKAFQREWTAGMLLRPMHGMEPMRSLILGTAAQLALDLGEDDKAHQAINAALEGNPTPEMRTKLKRLHIDHLRLTMGLKPAPEMRG